MQVNSDDWQPMYIDHIIRAANILTGHTMGDPLGYIRTGEASWHGATYHPLIALLKPFVSEPSWMRYAAPSASPHLGTCTAGTYGLVDDSDIQRTFTIEDPRVVHPEWDPALRTLMLDFKVRIGMTHEMVAFAMGYPSMSGTTAKLAQLPEWSWRPYSSCWADAKFEGDRVVKFSGSTECGSTIDIY